MDTKTNRFFPEIKKNFGFGVMRLPSLENGELDIPQTMEMVDDFLARGFNYFDTAHGYLDGKSETAIRECVVDRYPRDAYILTNKLSTFFFRKEQEILPLFEKQLEICGVDYFDFYLMHAQNATLYEKYKKCRAYETALRLKEQGRIRHFGISFHDKAEVLDRILTEYPQIEVVQIQLNYLDYEDVTVEGRKVYEVCEKHQKPVIVMEPVKGGSLVKLPEEAQKALDALGSGMSNASYAIRFAADFPNVCMVLSGMSSREQMQDNLSYMQDYQPLSQEEKAALEKVCKVFRSMHMIPCTGCRYCVLDNDCPQEIRIPDLFACYNEKTIFHSWNQDYYYGVMTRGGHKASTCVACGKCEKICPQKLPIRELLKDVAREFEKQK